MRLLGNINFPVNRTDVFAQNDFCFLGKNLYYGTFNINVSAIKYLNKFGVYFIQQSFPLCLEYSDVIYCKKKLTVTLQKCLFVSM